MSERKNKMKEELDRWLASSSIAELQMTTKFRGLKLHTYITLVSVGQNRGMDD